MKRLSIIPVIALILGMLLPACRGQKTAHEESDWDKTLPDTLKVGTLYSALSYFIYKGEPMGYD